LFACIRHQEQRQPHVSADAAGYNRKEVVMKRELISVLMRENLYAYEIEFWPWPVDKEKY
jgi:hypothetical protein